jgi:hypothetical protein
MRGKRTLIVLSVGLALAGTWLVAAAQDAKKDEAKYTYVGVKTCKMCHSKEATGDQYKVWAGTAHAKAFEALASDESKAAAKKLGIDDPQKADACLKCHVTAFPVMGDLENQKITLEEGISCESCHGPGSGYKGLKVMKDLYAGTIKPESVGLNVVDEKTCLKCHVAEGNPFHKEFKYDEYLKKIVHPIPKAEGK